MTVAEARAVARRSVSALGRGTSSRPAQVIVKRVSGAGTPRDACRMAEYIGRLGEFAVGGREDGGARGDGRPRVFSEWGEEIERGLVVGQVREEWGLVPAEANLSAAARLVRELSRGGQLVAGEGDRWWLVRPHPPAPEGHEGRPARGPEATGGGEPSPRSGRPAPEGIDHPRARRARVERGLVGRLVEMGLLRRTEGGAALEPGVELPREDVWARPQVHHFVLSVPVERREAARLEEAAREVVREAFAAGGFRALWAVHVEHGKRPHAHVLVQARGEWGQALATGPREMDVLRSRLAEAAGVVGIRVEATRRADRPEVVAGILRGEAVLRLRAGRHDYRDGVEGWGREAREAARLAVRVPGWLAGEHGQSFLRRLEGQEVRREEGGWLSRWRKREGEAVGDHLASIAARLREKGVFVVGGEDATQEALRAFEAMRREDDALARWYMCHRPAAFGPVGRGRGGVDLALRALVRGLPKLPASEGAEPFRAVRASLPQAGVRVAGGARAIAADLAEVARSRVALARREESLGGEGGRRFGDALERAVALRDQAAQLLEEQITTAAAQRRLEMARRTADGGRGQGGDGGRRDPQPDRGGRGLER